MKQCLLCLDYSKESLCPPCKDELPWVEIRCPGCGRSGLIDKLCAICLKQPCPWNQGLMPLHYLPPFSQMITQLKFSRQFHYARTLVDLFIETMPSGPLPELLLPVPLHPWRMLSRGFNQSTELCIQLSQRLKIPYNPYYLKRVKHGPAQRQSGKSARQSNMKGAFTLKRPIMAQHIALVDDVLTTGETLEALCRLIRAEQPDIRIDVWTMAQTPLA